MRFSGLPGLLLVGLALLFAVPSAATFTTDWLWFSQLGFASVFVREINAQFLVFGIAFAATFLFAFLNLRIARRAVRGPRIVLGTGADGRAIAIPGDRLSSLALPAALVVALVVGLAASANWLAWLSYFHAQPFGAQDPLFGRDVSFYVFSLPVYRLLRQHALTAVVFTLVGCGVYYVLGGRFVIEARQGVPAWPRFRLVPSARRHLALLVAVAFALLAWGAWMNIPGTLVTQATATVGFGASYVDVHAQLPFLRATVLVLLAGVVLAIWSGFRSVRWAMPVAIGLYLLVSIGGGVYATMLQDYFVAPNEQNREQPYIVHNIEATRRAYALDQVEARELSGDAELTADDIAANSATLENIRLWDHQPLLQTFAQIQEIRTYYDFISVDNDRYRIDDNYRQVMLSVRELNSDSLQNPSWVNEHLTYTHGYGLTLGPVNQVTTEGLPVLFVQDLPPVSTVDLPVTEPGVYFGELTRGYVIGRTQTAEFDYPRGELNETTSYNGNGGLPIDSLFRRLLFAIRFGSTEILLTDQFTPESRIMFRRQIVERAQTLAPFLSMFDADPYPVVSDGRIYWILDGYMTTSEYPYSSPIQTTSGTFNYIRNSVKVVIDAYQGDVTFYLAEPNDPLAQTMARVFPDVLRPLDEMPAGLREHVRYPEDIFRVQAQVYATYHMTNPGVFYLKEDQWQVPALDVDRNAVQMQPYYTVMRLPGESQTEFIQMLPFTPRLKDNLAAWMVARSDGEHYGRLLVFQFPKQKIVFGPRQIVGRISQDEVISPQVTLWNQQGSQVIWGTLLVIPVEESLLYIRPLYLRSADGRIPELRRVVVAYQNRIVMAETLTLALSQIFGRQVETALAPDRLESPRGTPAAAVVPGGPDAGPLPLLPAPPPAGVPADAGLAALAAEANTQLERALAAQRDGDWAAYGEAIEQVGETLRRMQAAPE